VTILSIDGCIVDGVLLGVAVRGGEFVGVLGRCFGVGRMEFAECECNKDGVRFGGKSLVAFFVCPLLVSRCRAVVADFDGVDPKVFAFGVVACFGVGYRCCLLDGPADFRRLVNVRLLVGLTIFAVLTVLPCVVEIDVTVEWLPLVVVVELAIGLSMEVDSDNECNTTSLSRSLLSVFAIDEMLNCEWNEAWPEDGLLLAPDPDGFRDLISVLISVFIAFVLESKFLVFLFRWNLFPMADPSNSSALPPL